MFPDVPHFSLNMWMDNYITTAQVNKSQLKSTRVNMNKYECRRTIRWEVLFPDVHLFNHWQWHSAGRFKLICLYSVEVNAGDTTYMILILGTTFSIFLVVICQFWSGPPPLLVPPAFNWYVYTLNAVHFDFSAEQVTKILCCLQIVVALPACGNRGRENIYHTFPCFT